jgi:hypothetical protein
MGDLVFGAKIRITRACERDPCCGDVVIDAREDDGPAMVG